MFVTKTTHEWNHGLGEIVSALLAAGMQLTLLQEHDSVPWEAVKGMVDTGGGEWRLADRPSGCRTRTPSRPNAGREWTQ